MKPKEIRELAVAEIEQRILEEEKELQTKRFQQAIAGLENPVGEVRERRRRIARLKGILNEKAQTATPES